MRSDLYSTHLSTVDGRTCPPLTGASVPGVSRGVSTRIPTRPDPSPLINSPQASKLTYQTRRERGYFKFKSSLT